VIPQPAGMRPFSLGVPAETSAMSTIDEIERDRSAPFSVQGCRGRRLDP
jgi:hypothetical protein